MQLERFPAAGPLAEHVSLGTAWAAMPVLNWSRVAEIRPSPPGLKGTWDLLRFVKSLPSHSTQPCLDWYRQVLQRTFLNYHFIYFFISIISDAIIVIKILLEAFVCIYI